MLKVIVLSFFLVCSQYVNAQNNGNVNGVQLAQKIAKRMKDTLGLTGSQKNKIYDVNMDLHNKKQVARVQHSGNNTALTTAIQNIEKTRDSLYKPIITDAQYIMYKQKKRVLIAN